MTEEPRLDSYFEALREDLPSSSDEGRIRRRLASAGVAVTLAAGGKTAVAGSTLVGTTATGSTAVSTTAIAKVGLVSALSIRFASLPLLAQLGIVTAGTTALASGPAALAVHAHRSSVATSLQSRHSSTGVERRQVSSLPVAPRTTEQQAELLSPPGVDTEGNVHAPQTNAPTMVVTSVRAAVTSSQTSAATSSQTSAAVPQTEVALPAHADEAITSSLPETTSLQSSPPNREALANGSTGTTIAPSSGPREALDARYLVEETRLIDNALAALRVRDLSLAARLLDEHARRFPHPRLWREQQRVREKLEEARNRA